jgi:hypothetical protein
MEALRKFDPYVFLAGHAEGAHSEVAAEASGTLAGLATLAGGRSRNANERSDQEPDVAEAQVDAKAARFAKADGESRTSLATLAAPEPAHHQNENESPGSAPAKAAKSANPSAAGVGADEWGAIQEERAAIIGYDGGVPCAWAEGFARLDPDRRPLDVPPRRWQTFIDDGGRFLDNGWAKKAATLGWGPLDLFGADRRKPFARIDHAGLLWLLHGNKLIELGRHKAVIETQTGALQCCRRKPVAVGEVALAWELIDANG